MMHRFYCEKDAISESFTDGGNDCGVDAVYVDRRGDEPVIHLFQSKVHESERKAANPFPHSSLEKLLRFFEILKNKKADLAKIVNPELEQKIHEIRHAVDRELPSFKVWLLSNGMPCMPSHAGPAIDLLERQDVRVEEFHLDELVEFCLNDRSTRTNHAFFARDTGVLEFGSSELRSVVGYISGLQLYKLLADLRDEKRIDYSIFNMNVRGFLGLDSPINREIFRSASSSENMHFASLNNGITIVGSQCRVIRAGTDNPKISIKRMSIVNGAQTCSAIFDAMKDYYPRTTQFDKLSVLFRIFETEDPELIARIAMSTNNQNRINPRDLRANDPEQVRLEVELKLLGVTYLRKRGVFGEATEGQRTLDALKAGQLLLSYVHQDPARAKRDSDSIFTDFYHKVFGKASAELLLEALDWYDLIDARRSIIQDDIRIRGIRRTENTFVTYGGFHVLTLCGLLGGKVAPAERPRIIDEAINLIAKQLSEAGEPAFYSFFRDPQQVEFLLESSRQPRLL
jgi:AIPR protein